LRWALGQTAVKGDFAVILPMGIQVLHELLAQFVARANTAPSADIAR
jgi:hypothetical protein